MKKRGFTLIEIIIVIALISVIGVGSVVGVKTIQKNKDELTEITNRIIESASVYIETEKDTNGNTYINGINEGGQGLILPLDTLYDEGYIKESDYKYIIKKVSNDKRYVVVGYKTEEECKTGGVEINVNWNDDDIVTTPLYLCTYTKNGAHESGDKLIDSIIDKYGGDSNIKLKNVLVYGEDFIQMEDYCGNSSLPGWCEIAVYKSKSGVYKRNNYDVPNTDNDITYYYRGYINDNYIRIKDIDVLFRILSFNENEIRVVTEYQWNMLNLEINDDYQSTRDAKLVSNFETTFSSYYDSIEVGNCGGDTVCIAQKHEYSNKVQSIFKEIEFCSNYTSGNATAHVSEHTNNKISGCENSEFDISGPISEYEIILSGEISGSSGINKISWDSSTYGYNPTLATSQSTWLTEDYGIISGTITAARNLCSSASTVYPTISAFVKTESGLTEHQAGTRVHFGASNGDPGECTQQNYNEYVSSTQSGRVIVGINPILIKLVNGSGTKYDPYIIEPK